MKVRNFIYIDVDSLYSLYSQVFEGVAEQITKQTLNESTRSRSASESTAKKLDSQVAEASLRIENTILFDHMYNRLEEALGQAVTNTADIVVEDSNGRLSDSFLIRAQGAAEIHDYERVRTFMQDFNQIGNGIAYAGIKSSGIPIEILDDRAGIIKKLQDSLRDKSTEQKREINSQIAAFRELPSREEYLKAQSIEMGLYQDPILLGYLGEWVDRFYNGGYEITIVPKNTNNKLVYRGVIDRRFLRLSPAVLRSLYGGYVDANWIMVGQVTYLPGTVSPPVEDQSLSNSVTKVAGAPIDTEMPVVTDIAIITDGDEAASVTSDSAVTPTSEVSMRDPFRNMFSITATFEKMFFESKLRSEVLIRPLAIYKEVIIPDIDMK